MSWFFSRSNGDALRLGDLDIFDGLDEFSLAAHCYLVSTSSDGHIYGWADAADDNVIRFMFENNGLVGGARVPKLFCKLGGASGSVRAEGADDDSFPVGRWCVIGSTFKAGEAEGIEIYVDGTRAGVGSTTDVTGRTFPAGTENHYIGRQSDSTGASWDGRLGEVAAWGAKLSAAEMGALGSGVSALLVRPGALLLHSQLAALQPAEWYRLPQAGTVGTMTHLGTPAAAPGDRTACISYYETMESDLGTCDASTPTYGPYGFLATSSSSDYRDTTGADGVTYRYQVRARDTSGNVGAFGSVVEAAPDFTLGGPAVVHSDYGRSSRARAQRKTRKTRRF